MSANIIEMVDATILDLQQNVAELAEGSVEVHRYGPWDPTALESDNRKHLAVWPEAEAEAPEPLANDAHQMNQGFVVLYWEPATVESSRIIHDEAASKALIELHEKVRDRFYVEANQLRAGAFRVWYSGAQFNDSTGLVRWFAVAFSAARFQPFTS